MNDFDWIKETNPLARMYEYVHPNNDYSRWGVEEQLEWLFKPQRHVRKVISVFNHGKFGMVVKVREIHGSSEKGTKWVRYHEFMEDIENGNWVAVEE